MWWWCESSYQGVASEDLLALLRERHLDDAQLPSPHAPPDLGAHGPRDDLVPEAHADDAHPPALEQPPRVLHEAQDPLVALEAVVFRAADEHGVQRLGVRVGGLVLVHDVVARELELRLHRLRGHGPAQQVGEDGAVAAVVVFRLDRGNGRVALEDGEADWWGGLGAHFRRGVFPSTAGWQARN